jgi:hypothetical protein
MGCARTALLALADDLLDLLPCGVQADPQRLQRLGRHAVGYREQSQQKVLSADVVVIQHPGFFLCQRHSPTCRVGEPFEHCPAQTSLTDIPASLMIIRSIALVRMAGSAGGFGDDHLGLR